MLTIREWMRRLWGALGRARADHDLEEELRLHVELLAEDARRQGHSAESATRLARLQAGGVAQAIETLRDQRGLPWLDDLWRDLILGARLLRRSPVFTTVAVLSLALGIGANTAIFSLIDTLILRPLPVRDPHQLVELLSRYPGEPRLNAFAWKYYEHYRDHNQVFADLIATSSARFQVRTDRSDAAAIHGEYVVGSYFAVLGVEPALGRMIDAQDDRAGAAAVAVVSWPYWQDRFHLDPAILGRQITVDGVAAMVVGVAPRGFFGLEVGSSPKIWVPTAMESLTQRPSRRADGMLPMRLVGRLKPGMSIQQAGADMTVLDKFRVDDIVKTKGAPFLHKFTIEVATAAAGLSTLRDHFAAPLFVLMAVVGLLLLIACTNVASMLLARGAARQREMAVRVSLGAGRFRLVRQMLTESLLLSAAGAICGVVLAHFGANALVRILTSGRGFVGVLGPLEIQPHLDARVLLFTAGVAVLTGVLFGLAPALNAFAFVPAASLRTTGMVGETRTRRLFGKGLVAAQIAVSLVLLSAAGLFIGHLSSLRNVGLGFDRTSVLLVTLDPARTGYQPEQLFSRYRNLLARLEGIPAVRSATLSGVTPIHGAGASRFVNVEGFQEPPDAREYTSLNWVAPNYFDTFRTPLVAGRDFQFEDQGRPRVAIVNQAVERYYFGDGSAIGQRFTFEGQDRTYEIVGVAGDAKYLTLHNQPPRTIYLNAFQESRMFSHRFSIRTGVAPTAVAADVQQTIADVLKTGAVSNVTTLADQVDASIVPERVVAMLSGLFGTLGAALAGLGLYGLMAYMVARRINEIGIRMALGATSRDVIGMVLGSAIGLVGAGLVIGVPMALWSRSVAASWIANLQADSALEIPIAAAVMMAVAMLSTYLPARRAARVDPAEALRHD